ncbi:MAG: heparan-alpha-glucosaminide N-acetyltransferase domain-containing protein [Ignavibacteria bacterium]|nr:heparan-alpha-glucosaminide N-acetyltransferase domain-containing protein [Ignavibacteria bacterium]
MIRRLLNTFAGNGPTVGIGSPAVTRPEIADVASPLHAAASRSRIDSVDLLRGLVMVIMALDHVRDYFTAVRFDPLDLTQTTAAYFFTRWITHFCAPVFVFLAGTGAFLSSTRGKSTKQLSRFLLTRGIWLIVVELTFVRLAWQFSFDTSFLFVQVIWAIGCSMIFLSGLVYLSTRTIAIIGVSMIALHNLLDGIAPESFGSLSWLWMTLHVQAVYPLSEGHVYMPFYPLIPWLGVMAAGYAFGTVFQLEPDRRRIVLLRMGIGLTAAFVVIRGINVYGDLVPWSEQETAMRTFFSFLNTTKYPPSLSYLLMTLGPSILFLGLVDRGFPQGLRPIIIFGRVPMFYYVVHLYVIHALAVAAGVMQGFNAGAFLSIFVNFPAEYGFNLLVVYVLWIVIVVLLYPLCKWFAGLKRRRKDWWLSYL